MTPIVVNTLQRMAEAIADLFRDEQLQYPALGDRAVVAELYLRVRERFPECRPVDSSRRRCYDWWWLLAANVPP